MDLDTISYRSILLCPRDGEVQRLRDRSFDRAEFEQFQLGPAGPPASRVEVENVSFLRCKVKVGRPRVYGGVALRKVEFDGLDAPDGLVVSTTCAMSEVTFSGRFSCLQIRPDEVFDAARSKWLEASARGRTEESKFAMDVRALETDELEIIGVPLGEIRWSPERHWPVTTKWRGHPEWDHVRSRLSLGTRLLLKRLGTFSSEEGLWHLPKPGTRAREEWSADIELLREIGLAPIEPSI